MATSSKYRQYVTVPGATASAAPLRDRDSDEIKTLLIKALKESGIAKAEIDPVLNRATQWFRPRPWILEAYGLPKMAHPTSILCIIEFDDSAAAKALNDLLVGIPTSILRFGADLPFGATQFWCPGEGGQGLFATRRAAETLMRSAGLARRGLRGRDVNVIVVDQGFDESLVSRFGGRWWNRPYQPPKGGSEHGNRTVRNILSLAPEATYYDLPLIPSAIADIQQFVSDAQAAFETVRHDIGRLRTIRGVAGPWVMANAWAVFDRSSEVPLGSYTERAEHPFNDEVEKVEAAGVDVVFAAGNCGQFCPDRRCSENGPGHSIWGANAHPRVLTVGAVRADTMWTGYSSQGPGPGDLERAKPDLCAPSQFSEDDDARRGNTGTSTACALVAGAVAAMRTRWDTAVVSPAAMRDLLRRRARPVAMPYDYRFGFGILDVENAVILAETQYP
jgi:hypothetical protein